MGTLMLGKVPNVGVENHREQRLGHARAGRRGLEDGASDALALAVAARSHERERLTLAPMLSRSAGALDRSDEPLTRRIRVWVVGPGRGGAT